MSDLPNDIEIRRAILQRAAVIANSGAMPPEAKAAGEPFREADHLSSLDFLTLSYDTDIFTGVDPVRVQQIDKEMRVIAQASLRQAILENGQEFVGLIVAGSRYKKTYLGRDI